MTPDEIERILSSSAEALALALRREIATLRRSGLTDDQILPLLPSLRLPSAQILNFYDRLKRVMSSIAEARADESRTQNDLSGGETFPVLSDADVNALLARAQMFVPQLRSDIRRELRSLTENAIAAGSGIPGLMDALKEAKLSGAKSLANTMVAGFNNNYTFRLAEEAGITTFLYSGPLGPKTREFCREHVGNTYTIDEILQMDNGQGLPVRDYCGGYNCRHMWTMSPL